MRRWMNIVRGGVSLAVAALGMSLLLPHTGFGAEPTGTAEPTLGVQSISRVPEQPVFVTHAGDARLFVPTRSGRILTLARADGVWQGRGTFLDLRGRVATGEPEQGFLGLAFHPRYAKNGRFYVSYTNLAGTIVLAEYRRSSRDQANPSARRVLLQIPKESPMHNGGWLGFKGRYLYMTTGDAGVSASAHDLGTLTGKVLRIDPIDPDGDGGRRYAIPADNPFVGVPGRDGSGRTGSAIPGATASTG